MYVPDPEVPHGTSQRTHSLTDIPRPTVPDRHTKCPTTRYLLTRHKATFRGPREIPICPGIRTRPTCTTRLCGPRMIPRMANNTLKSPTKVRPCDDDVLGPWHFAIKAQKARNNIYEPQEARLGQLKVLKEGPPRVSHAFFKSLATHMRDLGSLRRGAGSVVSAIKGCLFCKATHVRSATRSKGAQPDRETSQGHIERLVSLSRRGPRFLAAWLRRFRFLEPYSPLCNRQPSPDRACALRDG